MYSNLSEFLLLMALHLASMLTPGLNASAVISNTQGGGKYAGYRTAGFLSLGALCLSSISILALSSLLFNGNVRLIMALLSVIILTYFSIKTLKKMLNFKKLGASSHIIGGRELFWIYVLNPQSIVFFTVLIFSTGIIFDAVSSILVIFFVSINTLLYYSLLAKFSDIVMRNLNSRRVEFVTNALLLVFLLIALVKTVLSLWDNIV